MSTMPQEFHGVTVVAKANVYFDGRVVSHSILFPDGAKKTVGLVYPGRYHFSTQSAERMEIVAGWCLVTIDGQSETKAFTGGQYFEVPSRSGFAIEVTEGICEYICSYLPA
ncbi:MAG TPA: pyrimidine/purine nucleoside phosphorylase [Candidatus Paceibacterota bacterium]|nr:pyrimidine/purine nucleoside phosphorylase [Verrucomicrobiota bacterium]HRY52080.1 pyrimidine/purine nucleoside phosphorylase [Candidatus Paceibacterota bacterium]HSA00030.1 pyrimidine/purine nucleoside phosphorylase [Candidatus Paceibacterota bacterium]